MVQQIESGGAGRPASGETLTPREHQVLEMIARGLKNVAIADELGVTIHAVKFHLNGIYRKLGVHNRTAAAVAYVAMTGDAGVEAVGTAVGESPVSGLEPTADDLRPVGPRRPTAVAESDLPSEIVTGIGRLAEVIDVGAEDVIAAVIVALLWRSAGTTPIVLALEQPDCPAEALRVEVDEATPFQALVRAVASAREATPASDGSLRAVDDLLPHARLRISHGERAAPTSLEEPLFDLRVSERPRIALFAPDGHDEEAGERMLDHLRTLAGAATAAPASRVADLPVMSDAERQRILVAWNQTEEPVPDACLDELVAAQARRTPAAIAVAGGGVEWTFAELHDRAARLATFLRARGAGPGTLIGLAVERSPEMVAALLGILSSGAAYVPVDPAYPAERIRFMLEDAGAPILVTEAPLLAGLPETGATVVCLDRDREAIAACAPFADAVGDSERLAYVIYTSGSTGVPKGVEISHRALVNLLTTMARRPGFTADDILVAVTTLSFDIAGLELYLPLVTGGRVVVATKDQASDPRSLAELLDDAHATVLQATPTTWRLLVENGWAGRPGLKALCGGEALPQALADELVRRDLELWNVYGPTETTIWSTTSRLERVGEPVTIGRPIGNTTVYVLDHERRPVPVGVAGELYIGGRGLARGYRNRPDLTEERFVPSPFGPDGARLYRTGDLVRLRGDGNIEYLGRLDHQVKLRGFRIELGEVEAALEKHPAVSVAVAVVREDERSGPRLVGYVVADGVTSADLRRHAAETLPAYMVPAVVVLLDAFPLTPNGKIDRKALPAPTTELSADAASYVPARTPMEAALVEIWEEVLGISPIGVTDDFFELGQTSIVAARLFARIEDELGARLPISPLFVAPTIEQLASLLETTEGPAESRFTSLVPIQPRGTRTPIHCVHGGAGTILHLGRLARRLGNDQPFYALQARGLYGEVAPLTTVEAMADHYLSELRIDKPHGPYRLAGYCFGAIVAFDMAQRLLADGEQVELLAMFNGPSPDFIRAYGQNNRPPRTEQTAQQPARSHGSRAVRAARDPRRIVSFGRWYARRRINRIRWERQVRRFEDALAQGRPLPESVRDFGFLLLSARAEVAYRPKPFPGEIVMFHGEGLFHDPAADWGDPLLGWGPYATRVETHTVAGRHRDNRQLMNEPAVGEVAQILRAKLEALDRRPA